MNQDYLSAIVPIAQEAGQILMRHYGRVRVEYKGGVDLVTQADRESEAFIVARLRSQFPQHDIVAEEGGGRESGAEYRWYVDPLDGTTNFAHGLPMFAVSIGLEHRGRMVAGVVHHPVMQETFTALAGQGAALNGHAIHVSEAAELRTALAATGFPTLQRQQNPNVHFYYAVTLRSHGVRRMGAAALDLCYTACGRFEVFWEFGLKPWDVAAGSLILAEAGGRATTMTGEPYHLRAPELLATNGRVHDECIALFAEIFAGHTSPLPSAAAYLRGREEAAPARP